jgi:uncharacterized membrane protein
VRDELSLTELSGADVLLFLSFLWGKVPRGTEGAVSVEGTLAGVVGSLVIALYAVAVKLMPKQWCV